jgi:hypothetical protein
VPESDHAAQGAASLRYVCDDCGRVHNRNTPPCNDCGSMSLSAVEDGDDPTTIDAEESWELVRDADSGITGTRVFVYLVGALTLVVDVVEAATGTPVPGVALVAAGAVAMPPSRYRLERLAGTRLSPWAVLGAYLALSVGGYAVTTLA